MANFAQAFAEVLKHEGGYSNDPLDQGGATDWGISLRFLRSQGVDIDGDGDIDADDIKALDMNQASDLYHKYFWLPVKADQIRDNTVAIKLFDLAVNMGAPAAVRCLQRACRACGAYLEDDGAIGPVTLQTVNEIGRAILLPAFRAEAAGHYRAIVARNPSQAKWINGWLNRAYF